MRLKSEKRQKNRKDGVYFRYFLQGLISDPTGGAIPVNRGWKSHTLLLPSIEKRMHYSAPQIS